jgi:hypothetical protein
VTEVDLPITGGCGCGAVQAPELPERRPS